MNRRIKALTVLAVVAVAAAGCGGGSTSNTGSGTTLIVGVDVPFQGSAKDASDDTWNAMNLYLEQVGGKAGNYKVELKKYDDSTAAAGSWDPAQCTKNANDHVATANEVAVMGTFNSGCAKIDRTDRQRCIRRPHAHDLARQHQPRTHQVVGPGRA